MRVARWVYINGGLLVQVDKIIDQLQQLVQSYDLFGLKEYWLYLDRRLFSRLEDVYRTTVNKLRTSLYRYYVVNTVQVGSLSASQSQHIGCDPENQLGISSHFSLSVAFVSRKATWRRLRSSSRGRPQSCRVRLSGGTGSSCRSSPHPIRTRPSLRTSPASGPTPSWCRCTTSCLSSSSVCIS